MRPSTATSTEAAHRRLLVVSGPSGVGKGTVVGALNAARDDVEVAISATTRPPRPGEVDGVDYHFLDDAAFDELLARDGFLEWAQYHGRRYGTPWSSLTSRSDASRRRTTVVLEIDVQGAAQVRRHCPGALLVFLLPPSMADLQTRIRSRGSEDDADVRARLALAVGELARADAFDHQVVNAQVDEAVEEIARILDRLDPPRVA